MKRSFLFAILLFSSHALLAQWNISGNLGIALNRIDQAFRSGMQASRLVSQFFDDKQIVSFTTGLPGNASLIYSEGAKTDTVRVDVMMQRAIGGPEIRALNVSNYPMATMFFDLRKMKQMGKTDS